MMVLQYRTTYVNGTPFLTQAHSSCNSSSSATLDQRLKLLDVAFVRENGSRLDFPDDYTRDDIWPSKLVSAMQHY